MRSFTAICLLTLLAGCSALGYDVDRKRQSQAPVAKAPMSRVDSAMEIGTMLDYEAAKKVIDGVRPKPEAAPFVDVPDCAPDKKKVCSALEGCKCVAVAADGGK